MPCPTAQDQQSAGTVHVEVTPAIPRVGMVYPYQPPGARQPWPPDEYIVDGGDRPPYVHSDGGNIVGGLNQGDTIAQFETKAGKAVVEPANPVYIYSPRFGAVRQVVGFHSQQQLEFLAATVNRSAISQAQEQQLAASSKQHFQLQERATNRRLNQLVMGEGQGAVSGAASLHGFHDGFLPYENLQVAKTRAFDAREFTLLIDSAEAAQAWSHAAVLQVFIDNQAAVALPGITRIDRIYGLEERPTFPRLRIIKLASRGHAAPGEIIEFAIRFDNVGTEVINKVTIVDNLTGRLEFIDGSASCSLPGQFAAQKNADGSTALRWDLSDPLEPGTGGVIRFRCRVR